MIPNLASSDRELVQQLLDDIGVVEDLFLAGIPKPAATRATFVPILRRWIAEGLFYKAQKLILPIQVDFPIASSARAIKLCKRGIYVHWMGFVLFGTIGFAMGQVAQKHLGPDGKVANRLDDGQNTNPAPQKASTFFDQRMLFWKEQFYTRADLIKMHANALGGVHFDFRRAQDEKHIIEIKNYFGFEVKGNNRQMLVGEEISRGRADPARRQQIYDATELIAIDTARIFAAGIRSSINAFTDLLA